MQTSSAKGNLSPTPYITINHSQRLPLSDILYIESQGKDKLIVTKEGSYTLRCTMEDLAALLDARFVRCHRGFFVNMAQISSYAVPDICLRDGRRILLSRYRLSDFEEAYARYRGAV